MNIATFTETELLICLAKKTLAKLSVWQAGQRISVTTAEYLFIDLRDMYGVLQVVMRDTTLLEGINKEDCISLEGVIEHRDEETYNPKIPTGTIELEAHKVDMLGKVYKQLPFEVMTY